MSIAPLLHEQIGKASCGNASSIPSLLETSYSEIVQRIFLSTERKSYRTVAFTSPRSDNNVSFLCANLACILGPLHGRVLVLNEVQLLDAANELRVRGANFSKMEDAEIWIAPQKQLKAPFRAANSLLKGVLSLKQEFDFIIVDADSHQRGFPSPELINSIDGFILVVTEGQTELGEIANLRKKLVRAGGKIIGAIYNNSPREEK